MFFRGPTPRAGAARPPRARDAGAAARRQPDPPPPPPQAALARAEATLTALDAIGARLGGVAAELEREGRRRGAAAPFHDETGILPLCAAAVRARLDATARAGKRRFARPRRLGRFAEGRRTRAGATPLFRAQATRACARLCAMDLCPLPDAPEPAPAAAVTPPSPKAKPPPL